MASVVARRTRGIAVLQQRIEQRGIVRMADVADRLHEIGAMARIGRHLQRRLDAWQRVVAEFEQIIAAAGAWSRTTSMDAMMCD